MLNNILQQKRKELNLTQQEVAESLHVTRQTVSSWKVGKSIPDLVTLLKISELFDLSLDYMLKGDEKFREKIVQDDKQLAAYRRTNEVLKIIISGLLL